MFLSQMLKPSVLLVFLILLMSDIQAQKYGNALGIRVDQSLLGVDRAVGVHFKQRMFKSSTAEAILAFNLNEVYAKGLYNIHKPILYKGLNYFFGAGAHAGVYRGEGPFVGLDLTVGLELKVPALPLLITTDFTPRVNVNHPKSLQVHIGAGVLFVMRSERDIRRNKRKREKKRDGKDSMGEKLERLFKS